MKPKYNEHSKSIAQQEQLPDYRGTKCVVEMFHGAMIVSAEGTYDNNHVTVTADVKDIGAQFHTEAFVTMRDTESNSRILGGPDQTAVDAPPLSEQVDKVLVELRSLRQAA